MKPKAENSLRNHGEQVQGGQGTDREPVAIVGIGCRFPGGIEDPTSYWELLMRGEDAIVDVPADRWDIRRFYDADRDKPGKMYVRAGGFLREPIDQLDAMFFGITPREADCLDPQQRLLMEVAPIVPLSYRQFHILVKPWLKNVCLSATGRTFWKDAVIEPSLRPGKSNSAPPPE